MNEGFPRRKPGVQKFAQAAVLGAALAGPLAAGGSYAINRGVDKYLENHGLNEEAVTKYLEELKARLVTIKERQAVTHMFREMVERLAGSMRTGRLIRDDEFVIESQIKALESVKTIHNISYWVGVLSLWGSLSALFTGALYRKQNFDEVHEQTAYLDETLEAQRKQLEAVPEIVAKLISVVEAQREQSQSMPPDTVAELTKIKILLEDAFGVKTEDLKRRE